MTREHPQASRAATEVRVLIYTHDTFGLGNIRRMLAIAEHLVAEDPGLHVLMITGSPLAQGFRVPPRIDLLKLPGLSRDRDGGYGARSLPLELDELVRLRGELIRSALLGFAPDLFLVDKKPLGVEGELAPAFAALERLPRRPAVALVLRDILDAPEATRKVWTRNGYHEVLRRHYDLVLVAGQPEIFDLAREYRFPASTRRLLRYCGYLRRAEPARGGPCFREARPRVLVAVGGGADGAHLIRAYLDGPARGLPGLSTPESTVITGPELPEEEHRALESLAAGLPHLHLRRYCEDLPLAIAQSDLVVGMGGYNSLCEVLSAGRRALVIPRVKPVLEQWIRARRFAQRGLVTCLHPEQLTPERLGREVAAALAAPPPAVDQVLDFGGLERIRHWVQRLLAQRRSRPVAIDARDHFQPSRGRIAHVR